jgi:hypothetical protein
VGIKGYPELAIWQPVLFKNIPYHCYHCNGKGHLARECQEMAARAAEQTREVNTEFQVEGPNGGTHAEFESDAIHKPTDAEDAENHNVEKQPIHSTLKTGAQGGDSHLNGGNARGGTSPPLICWETPEMGESTPPGIQRNIRWLEVSLERTHV